MKVRKNPKVRSVDRVRVDDDLTIGEEWVTVARKRAAKVLESHKDGVPLLETEADNADDDSDGDDD